MSASFPGSVKSFGSDRITGDYIPASDTNELRAEVVALETAALAGGWIGINIACAYVSAVSFVLGLDWSGILVKGTRVQWTQTTVKYGVVASAVYAGGNTTVTLLPNSDYAVTNTAMSAVGYSNLDNPRGWPDWFNFSATFGANGAMTFTGVSAQWYKYRVSGRTIFYMIRATGTTGGTANTGLSASLPVAPVNMTYGLTAAVSVGDGGARALGQGYLDTVNSVMYHAKFDGSNYGLGAGRVIESQGFYFW